MIGIIIIIIMWLIWAIYLEVRVIALEDRLKEMSDLIISIGKELIELSRTIEDDGR